MLTHLLIQLSGKVGTLGVGDSGSGGHTGGGWKVHFNPFQKKFGRNTHVRTPYIAYSVLTHILIQMSGKMSSIEVGDSGSGGPYWLWPKCRM